MAEERKVVPTEACKLLLRKQERTINSISHAVINFRKLGQAKMTEQAGHRQQFLKEQLKEAKDLDSQIYLASSEEMIASHPYFTEDRFTKAIEEYHEAIAMMQGYLVSQSAPVLDNSIASVASESRNESRSIARLPRVELPRFDGEIREWEHFRDRFESLIINDASLSDADRLHFLNSSLTGKALKSISHLRITAANFPTAWSILNDEYEDQRELVTNYLKSLISLPSINRTSPESYSNLRSTIVTAVQALRNLERSPDTCFDLVILLATEQFDPETKREWDFKLSEHKNFASLEDLLKFLQTYPKVGAAAEPTRPAQPKAASNKQTVSPRKPQRLVSHLGVTTKNTCFVCNADHLLYMCEAFRALPVENRLKLIKENKRCINCFSSKHFLKNCTNTRRCQECSGPHHTLLHKTDSKLPNEKKLETIVENQSCNVSASLCLLNSGDYGQVLLPTARIKVYSPNSRTANLRAIVDPGSQATLLTERAAQLLHLSCSSRLTQVTSVGNLHVKSHAVSRIGIGAIDKSEPFLSTNIIIVGDLTRYRPSQFTSGNLPQHLNKLQLADDPLSSAPFDIILGSNVCTMLLRPGIVQTTVNEPAALNTIFGWVIFGNSPLSSFQSDVSINHITTSSLHADLQRFWELETIPDQSSMTSEEDQCEQHFLSTHTRRSDGRYVVRLPFKNPPPISIGNSHAKALKCLEHLRRRLDKDVEISKEYDEFMRVYENLGHMERISKTKQPLQCLYIPHHGVYKRNSESSQLRVVFNASSLTTSGQSLNDCLLAGPKLQNDLSSIILRWRQFKFVLISDISKMFRQIMVDPRDADYQRVLWRSSSSDSVREYRLLTVTYGTTCAPYLALRVIRQLAQDEGSHYPLALSIIKNQMYVDDFLFGGDSIDEVLSSRDHLIALLKKGGFTLSKWSGNHSSLLRDINSSDHVVRLDTEFSLSPSLKVLGIVWRPTEDVFSFNVSSSVTVPLTKRSVLSTIARLYDPLGWITPVSIKAKILMQRLWQDQMGWDEEMPPQLLNDW